MGWVGFGGGGDGEREGSSKEIDSNSRLQRWVCLETQMHLVEALRVPVPGSKLETTPPPPTSLRHSHGTSSWGAPWGSSSGGPGHSCPFPTLHWGVEPLIGASFQTGKRPVPHLQEDWAGEGEEESQSDLGAWETWGLTLQRAPGLSSPGWTLWTFQKEAQNWEGCRSGRM